MHCLHKLCFNSFILLFFERSSLFFQDLIESAKSICESKSGFPANFWLHGNFSTFDCRCLQKGFRKLKIVRSSHLLFLYCILGFSFAFSQKKVESLLQRTQNSNLFTFHKFYRSSYLIKYCTGVSDIKTHPI